MKNYLHYIDFEDDHKLSPHSPESHFAKLAWDASIDRALSVIDVMRLVHKGEIDLDHLTECIRFIKDEYRGS